MEFFQLLETKNITDFAKYAKGSSSGNINGY